MRVPRPSKGKGEFVQLGTYIPRTLRDHLDLAAKREGKTKQELVEEGLRSRVTPKSPKAP